MSSESELPDWNDPRIILFAFYGSVVVILAFCSCIHFSGWKCLVRRGRTEGDDEETEFDGRLYELIPKPTRLLMDYHRHNIIRSSLEDFLLTLTEEHTVKKDGETGDIEANNLNETEHTHVCIPKPGITVHATEDKRDVPKFCSICLSELDVGETVCWSQNEDCTHCYHQECLLTWFVSLGKQNSKMKRFPTQMTAQNLIKYKLECPCCRQVFLEPEVPEEKSKKSLVKI